MRYISDPFTHTWQGESLPAKVGPNNTCATVNGWDIVSESYEVQFKKNKPGRWTENFRLAKSTETEFETPPTREDFYAARLAVRRLIPDYRPILFSAPMVRAVLDGRKTQTRRVIKAADGAALVQWQEGQAGWAKQTPGGRALNGYTGWVYGFSNGIRLVLHCPYGQIGDRLWVRENWARSLNNVLFQADCVASEGPQGNTDEWDWDSTCGKNCWKPSIHMPRKASRITLEITDIRIERLQQITEADAEAEGSVDPAIVNLTAVEHFAVLWECINLTRGFGWDVNPWVWVVSFRRVQP